MKQRKTPLFDHLKSFVAENPVSFHVPGHKNGEVFLDAAASFYKHILSIDVTEITGMDDLHQPRGVIREAEELTKALYKTDASHFLIGGSTVGNLAMILATVKRGERVLIERNSHQSVFHAVELADARPVYLEVEVDESTGFSLGVSLQTLKDAIEKYKDAKAVVLTNPSYEGYGQDLSRHVQLAHEVNMVVIVDEAHGAHLLFDDMRWPKSALRAGADLVVQSAHKMLPAMTMTSFLHMQGDRIDQQGVRRYLTMLQSSSPSYPLMASLDIARAYLEEMLDEDQQGELTEKVFLFREKIGNGQGWWQAPQKIGSYIQDPFKLAIIPTTHASFGLQKKLENKGLYPELVTPTHLLLTLPFTKDCNILNKFEERLQQVLQEKVPGKSVRKQVYEPTLQREQYMSEPELLFSELDCLQKERIYWGKVEGRIAAETITPYPPGVPVIVKGEKISPIQQEMLKGIVENKINLQTGDEWIEKGLLVVKMARNEEIKN